MLRYSTYKFHFIKLANIFLAFHNLNFISSTLLNQDLFLFIVASSRFPLFEVAEWIIELVTATTWGFHIIFDAFKNVLNLRWLQKLDKQSRRVKMGIRDNAFVFVVNIIPTHICLLASISSYRNLFFLKRPSNPTMMPLKNLDPIYINYASITLA